MTYAFEIKWLDEVDSTNNEISRHLDEIDNLSVVSARNQFAGRGQRGNSWKVSPGDNLTFSVLLRPGNDGVPEFRALDQFRISQVTTIAVWDLLNSHGINSRIKWPNDIYVGNKKICGMLIENTLNGAMVGSSILGIGINVNQKEFDPMLMNPTSMSALTGERFSTDGLLEEFCGILGERLPLLDFPVALNDTYERLMYRFGEVHEYTDCKTGAVFKGKIVGVNELGQLVVENEKGERKEFGFKEISYII